MYKTKPLFLIVLFSLITLRIYCQNHWVRNFGSSGPEEVQDVVTDNSGNVFSVGYYSGQISGQSSLNLPTTQGAMDCFVQKTNANGTFGFAIGFGGTAVDMCTGIDIDAQGNILVCGYFNNSMAILGTTLAPAGGGQNSFVAKFTPVGGLIWAKSSEGTGADQANAVSVDADGNVYLTGEFSGSCTFGNQTINSLDATVDVYVLKYNSDGTVAWLKKGSGTQIDKGIDIDVDGNGDVYVSGTFSENITFDATYTNQMYNAIFLMKLSSSGTESWLRALGCGGPLYVGGVCVSNGSIYLCGDFTNTLFFLQNNQPPTVSLSGDYQNSSFVSKYDASGNVVWKTALSSQNLITGESVSLSSDGKVVMAGDFACKLSEASAELGGGVFCSIGQFDNYIAAFNQSSGLREWVRHFGGHGNDRINAIACAGTKVIGAGRYRDDYFIPSNPGNLSGTFVNSNVQIINQSSSYCNDSNYGHYSKLNGFGQDDAFINAIVDLSRQPLDFFQRSGNQCNRPMGDICINSTVEDSPCPDSVFYCGSTQFNVATFYGELQPQFNYQWSTGSSDNYIIVSTPGILSVNVNSANSDPCYSFSDSVVFVQEPFEQVPEFCIGSMGGDCEDEIVHCGPLELHTQTNAYSLIQFQDYFNIVQTWTTLVGSEVNLPYVNNSGVFVSTLSFLNGCFPTVTDTVEVTINPLPPVPLLWDDYVQNTATNFPENIDICINDTIVVWTEPTTNIDFQFSGNDLNENFVSYAESATIELVNTNDYGCQERVSFQLTVHDSLQEIQPGFTDLADTLFLCLGDEFSIGVFDSLTTGDNCIPQLTSLNWTVNSSSIQPSGQSNFCMESFTDMVHEYEAVIPGEYDVVIAVDVIRENPCGNETQHIEKNIHLTIDGPNGIPAVNIIYPDTLLCPGDSFLVYVDNPDFSVNWSTSLVSNNDSAYYNEPLYNHWINGEISVQSVAGCSYTLDTTFYITVEFHPVPQAWTDPANAVICPGDSVQLMTDAIGEITWYGPLGEIFTNGDAYGNITGFYVCTDLIDGWCQVVSHTVELLQYNTPFLLTDNNGVICNGVPVNIDVYTTVGAVINWNAPLSGNATSQIINQSGIYSCFVESCDIITNLTVEVIIDTATAMISTTSPDLVICANESIVLSANPGNYEYEWFPLNLNSQIIEVSQPYNLLLICHSPGGCSDTAEVEIEMYEEFPFQPIVNDTIICALESAVIEAFSLNEIHWSTTPVPGNPFFTGSSFEIFEIESDYTYYLYSSTANCNSEMTILNIDLDAHCEEIDLPNIFTPNDDGRNDCFPRLKSNYYFDLQIFNRWGDLIFESKDSRNGWDGKDKRGGEINEGVYYYILNVKYFDNTSEVRKGSVTLVKN